MNSYLLIKNIVATILGHIALFLGLFPHSEHVKILNTIFPFLPSLNHTGHVIFGFLLYAVAVLISQFSVIF